LDGGGVMADEMRPAEAGTTNEMRVVCCGCGAVMEAGDAPEPVSHGICRPCVYRLYPDMAHAVMHEIETGERYGREGGTLGIHSGAVAEAMRNRGVSRAARLSGREVFGLVLLACVLGMGGVLGLGFGWRVVCAFLAGMR